MAYQYMILRASFQESEDPEELFVSEADFQHACRLLASNPRFAPHSAAFTYQDGRIDFQAEDWQPDRPGVTQAAQTLALQLKARVFGEDDEEYAV